MAIRKQISCITIANSGNLYEGISHVGGENWIETIEKAISCVESGTCEFFVKIADIEVDVIVATSKSGTKYLRTKGDSTEENNLLNLEKCS